MCGPARKTVSIEYYAVLREQRGRDSDTMSTRAETIGDLYEELKELHAFDLPSSIMKVAVNGQFANWNNNLCDGDTVVFIQPVAGG